MRRRHGIDVAAVRWPLPNVWLGVSVEDRAHKSRINSLRETPAAVRFLSIEPLLEDIGKLDLRGIHWVIVGGESGRGARPFDLAWAWSIVKQCELVGVPVFVKQLGANIAGRDCEHGRSGKTCKTMHRSGADPSEWPEDLRVREFPC